MKVKLKLLILLLFFVCFSIAQEIPKVRYGKPTDEELMMKVYDQDSTANAVILYDEGRSYLQYDVTKERFMLEFNRFVRIKILKQTGTEWGNFRISFYSHGNTQEKVLGIDGVTINMEGNKSVKSELKKESIFNERETKYWECIKLSMPQVKIGSVIDLKYSIQSPLIWNLQPWKFQYTIPVQWSHYSVSYPEYFRYNHSSLGYHSLCIRDHKTVNENINFTKSYETGGSALQGGGQRRAEAQTITYMSNVYTYGAKDVPAIKEEPYLTTLDNFATRIKFELASTDFIKIQGGFKSYTTTWDDIVNQLLDDSDFGVQIKSGNFSNEVIGRVIEGKETERDKLISIYDHVHGNMKWDKLNSIYTTKALRKSYNEKNGNVADVNLTLLVLLREAGIEADPVVLSTRNHGILTPTFPSLSDFNYVIVRAIVDNEPVLLDATEAFLPAGELPFRCLNNQGVLVKKGTSEKIPLTTKGSRSNTFVSLEMINGKMTGTISTNMQGGKALDFRQEVSNAGGKKEYFEKLKNNSSDISYLDYSITNLDSIYGTLGRTFTIEISSSDESVAAMQYINPNIFNRLQKNPFTSPSREYPVDFGYTLFDNYVLNLKIPEGYQVDELPKNAIYTVGNKDGSYLFQIAQQNDVITLNKRFVIGKTMFLPEEYQNLRTFYDMIVAKESEQIILKKTN